MALTKEEKALIIEELKTELKKDKRVYVEVCRQGVELPKYANVGDAGMDVRAAEEVILLPGETKIIPTGLKMAIPEGYELQVRPRSGLSLNTPLRVANSPGTVDSGYKDEIAVIINNTSPNLVFNVNQHEQSEKINYNAPVYNESFTIDQKGNKQGSYLIKAGDRIAQIVLVKFENMELVLSENIKEFGINRGGGFGSTGIK